MQIDVLIIAETKRCTLSQLRIDGQFQCFVLEDGYREKKQYGETRIPDGTYQVAPRREGKFYEKYNKLYRHDFVPHLLDVPGFEYILMHMGNAPVDTHGCLLVGHATSKGPTGDFLLTAGSSKPAYQALYAFLEIAFRRKEPVTITLRRDQIIKPATA